MALKPSQWLLLSLFFLLTLVTAGCKIPQEPTFQGISKFRVNGRSEENGQTFSLGLDLHNPNPFKLKMLAYDLELYMNGSKLGEAHNRGKQVLVKSSTTTIFFDVQTSAKQVISGIFGALSRVVKGETSTLVRVQGTVLAQAHGIRKQVPVTFEKRFELNDW